MKTCPFCGSEGVMIATLGKDDNFRFRVQCVNCQIRTTEHLSMGGAMTDWEARV